MTAIKFVGLHPLKKSQFLKRSPVGFIIEESVKAYCLTNGYDFLEVLGKSRKQDIGVDN